MGVTIGEITVALATYLTEAGVGEATAAFIAEQVVNIVITATLTYTAQALIGQPSVPSQRQKEVFRQARASRMRYYGHVKFGGLFAFLETNEPSLYQIIMPMTGRIHQFVVHWLGDDVVSLDGDGAVITPTRFLPEDASPPFVHIYTRKGSYGQAAFQTVMDAFPGEWTANHRLREVVCVAISLRSPKPENFSRVFPSGPPRWNAVADATMCWDPRIPGIVLTSSTTGGTFTTATAHGLTPRDYDLSAIDDEPGSLVLIRNHSGASYFNTSGIEIDLDGWFEVDETPTPTTFTLIDPFSGQGPLTLENAGAGGTVELCQYTNNGVLIALDYGIHYDAARIPRKLFENAIETWKLEADRADDLIARKAGDTELRFRLSGGYDITAQPKQVWPQILVPMDASLRLTPSGGIKIGTGNWTEPTVHIEDKHILDYSELRRSRTREELKNEIRSIFSAATEYNYEDQDADPYVRDWESVTTDGLLSFDLPQHWVPSHAQARRRMKPEGFRQNPTWSGTIQTNAFGLTAISERYVRLTLEELGIDGVVFEVLKWGPFNALNGNCTLQLSAMPEEAWTWDPELDEGTAPVASSVIAPVSIGAPAGFDATGGTGVLYAFCDGFSNDLWQLKAYWRTHDDLVSDDDAAWTGFSILVDETHVQTPSGLAAGNYDVRGRIHSASTVGTYDYVRNVAVT